MTQNATMFQLTGATKYSPDKYYTKSTDGNGHYERVPQVKIPPSIEALANEIVALTPEYTTVQDLIRDALLHRIMYIKNNLPQLQEAWQWKIDLELDRQAMAQSVSQLETWEAFIDEVRDSVSKQVQRRNWQDATATLQRAENQLDNTKMPEGLRDELEQAINTGWGMVKTGIGRKRYEE